MLFLVVYKVKIEISKNKEEHYEFTKIYTKINGSNSKYADNRK